MSIEEIKQYFDQNGGKSLPHNDKHWNILFDMYFKATKNKLSIGCGGCYQVGYKWLQKQ
jgi:hypothetical protein